MKKIAIFYIFLLMFQPVGYALDATTAFNGVPTQRVNLVECLNLSLNNDPTFLAAIKDHDATTANLTIGRSAMLPKVTVGSTYANNTLTNLYTGNVSQVYDNYPSSNNYVQAIQPIFDLAAMAKYREGIQQKNYGDFKFQANTLDLLIRVTQAYLDVLFGEDQVALLKSENAAYFEQMQAAQKSFQAGEASKIDYLEAKSAYEVSLTQIDEAVLQVRDFKRKLSILIGRKDRDTDYLVLAKVQLSKSLGHDLPNNLAEIEHVAMENNPDLQALESKAEIAKEEINKVRANYYPQISAVATWSKQDSYSVNTININSTQTLLGIQLTWPILTGGETLGMSRQAAALLEKTQAENFGYQVNLLSDLRKYFEQATFYENKIKVMEQSLISTKETQKAVKMGMTLGYRTNAEVLVATKNIYNVNKNLTQARYAYILAVLKTKQLSGLLKVHDLEGLSQ